MVHNIQGMRIAKLIVDQLQVCVRLVRQSDTVKSEVKFKPHAQNLIQFYAVDLQSMRF